MANQKHLPKLYRRMPAIFGPFPGPRQTFEGYKRDGSKATALEGYITFQTPKSEVHDLLPQGLRFQNDDAMAYLTVTAKRFANLDWLAGRGYCVYSIYLHGVECQTDQSNTVKGTFIPVVWEDLADPIISGREELGYPKVFADMAIEQSEDHYSMDVSWKSTTFAKFRLNGLKEAEDRNGSFAPAEAGDEQGVFFHKYIPSTGAPGTADVDGIVFMEYRMEDANIKPVVTRKLSAESGLLEWDSHNWNLLPTLHHIVSRIVDISIDKYVRYGIIERLGGSDLASARLVYSVKDSNHSRL